MISSIILPKTSNPFKWVIAALLGIVLVILLMSLGKVFEDLDAKEIMVIQSPFSGELAVYTEPGMKWQGWGTVTKYPRRDQYSFSSSKSQGEKGDQSIPTGFNDGGKGNVSGVVSWEMPLKPDAVVRLHKEYGSFRAIDQQLIRPMLEKVIFSAGATMSSIESSSERKPEIPQMVDDQLQNGPYLTTVSLQTQKDSLTSQDKTVRVVTIAADKVTGKPLRASASTIKEYGITLMPVTINDITYSPEVTKQITDRQQSMQAVQLSIASAAKATQDAITTEQQGKATAAKAKWEQESVNAKEIALAEKGLTVAQFAAKTAAQFKQEQILIGEGEAARKRLVMEADGALDNKLKAYVEVNKAYADAIQNAAPGAWTPAVVMGSSGSAGGGAQALIEMMSAKYAKELGIDMGVVRGNTAKK